MAKWLLLFAFFIISMSIHACMIHLVPMLKDRGMTPARAAFAALMTLRLGSYPIFSKTP